MDKFKTDEDAIRFVLKKVDKTIKNAKIKDQTSYLRSNRHLRALFFISDYSPKEMDIINEIAVEDKRKLDLIQS